VGNEKQRLVMSDAYEVSCLVTGSDVYKVGSVKDKLGKMCETYHHPDVSSVLTTSPTRTTSQRGVQWMMGDLSVWTASTEILTGGDTMN
jgi:hypothetical protein